MSIARDIAKLQAGVNEVRRAQQAEGDACSQDPAALMAAADDLDPDPWQRRFLEATLRQTLMLVTRQGGKSTTTAAKSLHRAIYTPGRDVLIVAPTERQSAELLLKARRIYNAARPSVAVENASALRLEFVNGSRIIALPGSEKTVRGFSDPVLVVIDEAARVPDELYYTLRPMLAVSGGELVAMTTPWGKRGWFFDEWTEGGGGWERIRVTAHECPRITAAFLEEERRRMPETWYRSEYLCEFTDTIDALFSSDDIERAFASDVEPLFGAPATPEEGIPTLNLDTL